MIITEAANRRTSSPRGHNAKPLPPRPHEEHVAVQTCDSEEKSVIGSYLLDPDCFPKVAEQLPSQTAFTGIIPKAIYAASLALHTKGDPIDGVTIRSQLLAQGFVGIKEAFRYMEEAVESVPSAVNVMSYARTVHRAWQARILQSACYEALQGMGDGATMASVLSKLNGSLAPLASPGKEEKQWPAIRGSAFHGLAGELVRLTSPHTEADPIATLFQFLIAFGNAAGRNVCFQIGASHHYLNLFGCLIGPTNSGRKGSSLDGSLLPMELADTGWANECHAGGLSSGEGLIHAVRDARYEGDDVVDEGVSDKRLLVVETELAAPIQRMGREGNTLSTIIRQAWDTGKLRTMTKGSPVRATSAHISIIAHVTPDELRKLLTATDQTNGFANRFLWCLVRRSKYLPFGGRIDEALLSPILQPLRDALEFAKEPREIIMSQSAAEAWEPEYRRLTQDTPGIAGAMTARGAPIVRRLACIYACLDCSDKVELPHLQAALALWDYCRESVEYVFGDVGPKKESTEDRERRELIQIIESNGGRITPRELKRRSRRYQPTEVAEGALESLIAAGLGKWEITTSVGGFKPVQEFVFSDVLPRSQMPLPAKIKGNSSNGNTEGENRAKSNDMATPDDGNFPVELLECEAAGELQRQNTIHEEII